MEIYVKIAIGIVGGAVDIDACERPQGSKPATLCESENDCNA
jgi:hypothetical protein